MDENNHVAIIRGIDASIEEQMTRFLASANAKEFVRSISFENMDLDIDNPDIDQALLHDPDENPIHPQFQQICRLATSGGLPNLRSIRFINTISYENSEFVLTLMEDWKYELGIEGAETASELLFNYIAEGFIPLCNCNKLILSGFDSDNGFITKEMIVALVEAAADSETMEELVFDYRYPHERWWGSYGEDHDELNEDDEDWRGPVATANYPGYGEFNHAMLPEPIREFDIDDARFMAAGVMNAFGDVRTRRPFRLTMPLIVEAHILYQRFKQRLAGSAMRTMRDVQMGRSGAPNELLRRIADFL